MRHAYAIVDGLRLHRLHHGGNGPPVVLLHGVTGHAWIWDQVASELVGFGSVLAVDMRGHGDSQWSADGAYTTADHVSDLHGSLTAMDLGAATIVGSSWGALVGFSFAARYPEMVSKLVIIDVEPSFEQTETDVPPMASSFASHVDVVGAEQGMNPFASPALIEVIAANGTRPTKGGGFAPKHDPYFLERWPFRSDDHWDELAAIRAPTLLVHAEQSFVRREIMEDMAGRLKSGTLVQVSNSGHVVPVDNPVALTSEVADFLSRGHL